MKLGRAIRHRLPSCPQPTESWDEYKARTKSTRTNKSSKYAKCTCEDYPCCDHGVEEEHALWYERTYRD